MHTPANKGRDSQVRAIAHRSAASKQEGDSAVNFVDNSAESLQLARLREMADNSPMAANAARLQAIADRSPYSVAQRNKAALQRQAHRVGNPVSNVPMRPIPAVDSDAYYHIANNAGGTVLSSASYGSCVGLAIYRAAVAATATTPAVPSRGMIVHFWAGGARQLQNFVADVASVLIAWGAHQPGDVYTIWSGTRPDHQFSTRRMNRFPGLLPVAPTVRAHASGAAFLDLDSGQVTP